VNIGDNLCVTPAQPRIARRRDLRFGPKATLGYRFDMSAKCHKRNIQGREIYVLCHAQLLGSSTRIAARPDGNELFQRGEGSRVELSEDKSDEPIKYFGLRPSTLLLRAWRATLRHLVNVTLHLFFCAA